MSTRTGKFFTNACTVAASAGFAVLVGFCASAGAQTIQQVQAQTVQKYDDLVRNNQIPQDFVALHNQLSAREEAVRIKAVQGIALTGSPVGALLLRRAIDDDLERSSAVRQEAAKGLGEIGGREALEVLGIGLSDKDSAVRLETVEALRWAGTVFAIPYIQEALRNDRTTGVRMQAVRMLRKIGTQFAAQPLNEALLSDRDSGIRLAVADALGEIGKKERQVARILGEAMRTERNTSVRLEIVKSLGLVREKAGLPFLATAMETDRDLSVRLRATEIYGRVLGLQ